MYICDKCGEVFAEPRIVGCPTEPDRGECCPNCGNEYFDDAVHCKVCGECVPEGTTSGDYHYEVCQDCLKARSKDVRLLMKATERYKETVEIPVLYRYILDDDEIKAALWRSIKEKIIRDSSRFKPIGYDEFDTTDFMSDFSNEIANAITDEIDGKEDKHDDGSVAAVAERAS